MALTVCPECSSKVSSFAKDCPHCGYPLCKHSEIGAVLSAQQKYSAAVRKAEQCSSDPADATAAAASWAEAAIIGSECAVLPSDTLSPSESLGKVSTLIDEYVEGYPDLDHYDEQHDALLLYVKAVFSVGRDLLVTADLINYHNYGLGGTDDLRFVYGDDPSPAARYSLINHLRDFFYYLHCGSDICSPSGEYDELADLMALRNIALAYVSDTRWATRFEGHCVDLGLCYQAGMEPPDEIGLYCMEAAIRCRTDFGEQNAKERESEIAAEKKEHFESCWVGDYDDEEDDFAAGDSDEEVF